MLRRLIAFLVGTVRIEVRGGRLAWFLNLALERGISLRGIRRGEDRMAAVLTVSDFRRLRPVARGSRSRVRVIGKYGFPILAHRLRARPVLLAGVVACLGFMLWVSGHIWVVEVRVAGPQYLDPRAVAAVAAEAGLKRGAWRSRLDLEQVRRHMEGRMPETSWVVLRIQGTRAVIEVVEKQQERRAESPDCAHLVAKKAGVIEQVIPFQGEPMVKPGQTVAPGDLLIECSFRYYPGGRPSVYPGTPLPPRTGSARTLAASGIVRARIAYLEYREVPLYREVPVPTGRRAVRWVLNWKERPILQGGGSTADFGRTTEVRKTYPPLLWRNWRSPVEIVLVHLEEVEIRREPVAPDQIIGQVRAELESRLRWMLGPSDRLLTPIRVEVADRAADHVGLRVRVETLEEITAPTSGVPFSATPQESKEDH